MPDGSQFAVCEEVSRVPLSTASPSASSVGDRFTWPHDCQLVALEPPRARKLVVPIDDFRRLLRNAGALAVRARSSLVLVGIWRPRLGKRLRRRERKRIWRTYTVPAPDSQAGTPGKTMDTSVEAAPSGSRRLRSRVEHHLLGTGNPARGSLTIVRHNLYTDSTLRSTIETGP